MHLKLERPLVFLDLESTGLDSENDRIVQIGMVQIRPDGERRRWQSYVNPGTPIPPQATEVHGIGDQDVADAPSFAKLAPKIVDALQGRDLAGFNVYRFDLPMLEAELRRCGLALPDDMRVVDLLPLYHRLRPRTLAAAFREFVGHSYREVHDALADATAAAKVLETMLGAHEDLPRTVAELEKECMGDAVERSGRLVRNDAGEVCWRSASTRAARSGISRDASATILSGCSDRTSRDR